MSEFYVRYYPDQRGWFIYKDSGTQFIKWAGPFMQRQEAEETADKMNKVGSENLGYSLHG